MKQFLNEQQEKNLLDKFVSHFPTIEDRQTTMWKIRANTFISTGYKIQCRNGTRDFITPNTCQPIIDEWNKDNPELKLKEIDRWGTQDDEVWTFICWHLDFENVKYPKK